MTQTGHSLEFEVRYSLSRMCKRLCSENPGRTRVKQSHEGRNPRDIGRNDLASYYIPVQLVFQISRWSCQVWPLRFQMTMYFPATLAGPLSPGTLSVKTPTSPAISLLASTSTA